MGRPSVRVRQLSAVAPYKAGLFRASAPQGDVLFLADQLFPVNARADADLGGTVVGHRQHGFGDRGKISASVLRCRDREHGS